MPKNPNHDELEKEKQVANNLESLLFNMEDKDLKRNKILGAALEDMKPDGAKMNFSTVRGESEKEARDILESVTKFYLSEEMVNDEEYIKSKKKIDELTLTNIIFSLKTIQYSIVKLLEEIDLGNTNPRVFEALAQLQNQMMNTVKHQVAYTVSLQENYKQLKRDSETVSPKQLKESGRNSLLESGITGVKTRGTKDLMNNLENSVDFVDIPSPQEDRLTDPKNRPDTPTYAKEKKEEDTDKPFSVDENQF